MEIVFIVCIALSITVIALSFISFIKKSVLFIVKVIVNENCKINILTETILIAINIFITCVLLLTK